MFSSPTEDERSLEAPDPEEKDWSDDEDCVCYCCTQKIRVFVFSNKLEKQSVEIPRLKGQ